MSPQELCHVEEIRPKWESRAPVLVCALNALCACLVGEDNCLNKAVLMELFEARGVDIEMPCSGFGGESACFFSGAQGL